MVFLPRRNKKTFEGKSLQKLDRSTSIAGADLGSCGNIRRGPPPHVRASKDQAAPAAQPPQTGSPTGAGQPADAGPAKSAQGRRQAEASRGKPARTKEDTPSHPPPQHLSTRRNGRVAEKSP